MAKPDRAARDRRVIRVCLTNGLRCSTVLALVEREVKRAVEECAQIAEGYAEELKHTCHYGGPGFGDFRGEMACKHVAAAIRARGRK